MMVELFQSQLARVLSHLTLESESVLLFAGQRFQVPPIAGKNPVSPHPLPADPLVRYLQAIFYAYCYSRPFAGSPLPQVQGVFPMDQAFVAQLSAANKSREVWDQGWEVYLAMPDGRVFAKKADRQRAAAPGEFVTSGAQPMASMSGATINLLQRRESIGLQPGFYYGYSEVPNDVWDDYTLVRFYFHLESAGAAVLVEQITSAFNAFMVPFQFKTLDAPAAYDRTDSAVLYLARRYYEIAARLILVHHSTLSRFLKPATPFFTRKLMDGVGVADDPGNGESFGMNRCRLLAEGIVDAFRSNATTPEARLQAVRTRFALNRLDMNSPHLGAGLVDFPTVTLECQEIT